MTNHDIAACFQRIADTLEMQGENPFKIRAYRRAVDAIENLDEPLSEIEARGALAQIEGFGDAIVAKTRDFLATGTTKLYEQVRDAFPAGVLQMAAIPGIGPKTAKTLWEQLGVTTVEELEAAARAGRVRTAPGFAPVKEQKLIEAIERSRRLSERTPLHVALPYAERLAEVLTARPEVVRADVAGSVRRRRDTVANINVAVATTDAVATAAAVAQLPGVTEVMESGAAAVEANTYLGLRLDVRLSSPESYGALLRHFCSAEEHNAELSALAASLDLTLDHAGLVDRSGTALPAAEEEQVYAALGLQLIEPELREGRGEIEAARQGSLPRLITEADFRGQLHEHTTWSDGSASIREMAEAAIQRGYEYLAITDHSRSLQIANGLSRDRLLAQLDEIAALKPEFEERGFALLSGIEADILADGSLDCEDDLLARLDIVVGSVHIRHKQDEAEMTARIVRALENPRLNILGHPTGRLLGRREPFGVDMDAVIETAARTGAILEINASPDRMDLSDVYARRAMEGGCRITINSDAHSIRELGNLSWGLHMARRAWLTPADVVNTYSIAKLIDELMRR